nr:TRAF3-interacting protein 1-like [Cherax quadricarinatus]
MLRSSDDATPSSGRDATGSADMLKAAPNEGTGQAQRFSTAAPKADIWQQQLTIISDTGFLFGLYTEEELNSQNIKDKDAKVAFLQKCIDATILATGENLSVRPAKIVAGQEADKTNEWLQVLGRAITQNVDSSEAVQQVLSGVKPGKGKKPDKEKTEKKPDKGKKTVAANNRSVKDNDSISPKDPKVTKNPKVFKPIQDPKSSKDPKPAQDPKPSSNPKTVKDPKSSRESRPVQGPKSSRESRPIQDPKKNEELRPGKESRNTLVGNSSSKPLQDKGSPVKSSKSSSGDKEKSGKSSKGKKEDGKSVKSAKERRSKDGKDDKEKKQPKSESPEQPKSSKSRPASRISQVKEAGKENSPPHEIINNDEMMMMTNGHATVEEMGSVSRLGSARPRTAQPDGNEGAADVAEAIDEGIVTQEALAEESESPPLPEPFFDTLDNEDDKSAAGAEAAATEVAESVDEGIVTQDAHTDELEVPSLPEPFFDTEGNEGMEESLMAPVAPEVLTQGDGELKQEVKEMENTPVISDTPVGGNDIDPAILKAMAPNNDQEQDGQLGASHPEPPDSGVGSLDSPKHSSKEESLPMAPTPKPGVQPLRALEQFGEGSPPTSPPLPQLPTFDNEEYPSGDTSVRPRTGRRSARPPSARPAPPKVRERREIPKEELQRPGTGKPVANVILSSGAGDNDDDDDNFVVEETKPALTLDEDANSLDAAAAMGAAAAAATVGEDGEGAGLLVAQILETKKELEDGRRNAFSPETPGHRRVPIEQALLSDANRKKERELIHKDVQKLSGSIQSITRSVNPLGKSLMALNVVISKPLS